MGRTSFRDRRYKYTEVNVIKTVWIPKPWEREIYKKRGEMR